MKNTGIVRKIDDLGRVVIPKEIRKTMFIKEGTPLEIHITDEGDILLKKHNIIKTITDISQVFCEVVFSCLHFPTLITDCNKVVACEGTAKRNYLNKNLSEDVKNLILESQNYTASVLDKTTLLPVVAGEEIKFTSQIIIPIIYEEISVGTLVLLGFDKDNTYSNIDVKVLQTLSLIMSKLLD